MHLSSKIDLYHNLRFKMKYYYLLKEFHAVDNYLLNLLLSNS